MATDPKDHPVHAVPDELPRPPGDLPPSTPPAPAPAPGQQPAPGEATDTSVAGEEDPGASLDPAVQPKPSKA